MRTPRWRLLLGLALVFTVIAIGAAWYAIVEGFELLDAVYQSVVTVTTVGFGEVSPLDQSGRLFTIVLIIVGVGSIGVTLAGAVETLLESTMTRFTVRRKERSLDRLSGHLVVCGFGRVGQSVLNLLDDGTEVAVIELEPTMCDIAERHGLPIVEGDCTDDDTLRRAGIERADTLIVCVGSDSDAISTVLSARSIKPELRIISRANEQQSINKLRLAGADQIVSPIDMAARRLVADALHPELATFLEVATLSPTADVSIRAVRLAAGAMTSIDAVRTIEDASGAMVIGFQNDQNQVVDAASMTLGSGGTVFVSGTTAEVTAFDEMVAAGGG